MFEILRSVQEMQKKAAEKEAKEKEEQEKKGSLTKQEKAELEAKKLEIKRLEDAAAGTNERQASTSLLLSRARDLDD